MCGHHGQLSCLLTLMSVLQSSLLTAQDNTRVHTDRYPQCQCSRGRELASHAGLPLVPGLPVRGSDWLVVRGLSSDHQPQPSPGLGWSEQWQHQSLNTKPDHGAGARSRYYEPLRDELHAEICVTLLNNVPMICKPLIIFFLWFLFTKIGTAGRCAEYVVCTPGHTLPDFCHKIAGNERASPGLASSGAC